MLHLSLKDNLLIFKTKYLLLFYCYYIVILLLLSVTILQVRAVVARLRQSFLETNEEIRSLIRAKAMIEKAHEHTRKDIQLNKDSVCGREARPQREKVCWVMDGHAH